MSRLDYCNGLLYGTPAVHLTLVSCNACRTRRLGWYVLYPGVSHHTIPDQPALASGYSQNISQDSNASSQMYLRCRTTASFRLNKNQRELAVSVKVIPGHTSNGQYP